MRGKRGQSPDTVLAEKSVISSQTNARSVHWVLTSLGRTRPTQSEQKGQILLRVWPPESHPPRLPPLLVSSLNLGFSYLLPLLSGASSCNPGSLPGSSVSHGSHLALEDHECGVGMYPGHSLDWSLLRQRGSLTCPCVSACLCLYILMTGVEGRKPFA